MKNWVAIVLMSLFASSAFAATLGGVHDCEGLDSIANLIGNTKFLADGNFRLAHVSTEEPAAASDHLLIFISSEEMSLSCYAVSAAADGTGFSDVDFDNIKESYPTDAKGVLLTVPVSVYNHETGSSDPKTVYVRVMGDSVKIQSAAAPSKAKTIPAKRDK